MPLYCGVDLHSNNCVVSFIDDEDKILLDKKFSNDPALIITALAKYKKRLQGVAVESTFNWYWLVRRSLDFPSRERPRNCLIRKSAYVDRFKKWSNLSSFSPKALLE